MQRHGASSGGLAKDGDEVRIASEGRRVVPEPSESQSLIPETHIARSLFTVGEMFVQIEKPKSANSVLHGGDDGVAGDCHDVRVVDVQGSGAAHETTSIDPDQKWQAVLVPVIRRLRALVSQSKLLRHPDVQVQTIFGDVGVGVPHFLPWKAREVLVPLLVAAVGQHSGIQDSVPGFYGQRLSESERPYRRLGKGNSIEYVNLLVQYRTGESANQAAGGLHHLEIVVHVVPLRGHVRPDGT